MVLLELVCIQNLDVFVIFISKFLSSELVDFIKRLDELKAKLLSRGYRFNFISKAFEEVKLIDRKVAIKKVEKRQ